MGDPIKDIVQIELHLNRLMALRVLPQLTKKKHEHPATYSIISKTFIKKKNIYTYIYVYTYILQIRAEWKISLTFPLKTLISPKTKAAL